MRRDHKLLVALLSLVGLAAWIFVLALSFEFLRTFVTTVVLMVVIWAAFLLLILYLMFHPLAIEARLKTPMARRERILHLISHALLITIFVGILISDYLDLAQDRGILVTIYFPGVIINIILCIIAWIILMPKRAPI